MTLQYSGRSLRKCFQLVKKNRCFILNTTSALVVSDGQMFGVAAVMIDAHHAIVRLSRIIQKKFLRMKAVDEQYDIIESCSWGPFIELFARGPRKGWFTWGNQSEEYNPDWATYANHSQRKTKGSKDLFDKIGKFL